MSPSSSRTRPLKGEASKVYKLFKSGDDGNFMVAMSLVDAVLDGLEVLLDDLHVSDDGQIKSDKRFKGNDKNQHHLNALMWYVLTSSPSRKAEEFRDKVKIINTTTSSIPALSTFPNIEKVIIRIGLESVIENLIFLGSTSSLKSLSLQIQHTPFNLSGKKPGQLKSLKGLDAPNLISLTASTGLLDVFGIERCTKLEELILSSNQELESLTPVSKIAPSLVNVELSNSPAIVGLEPLRKAANLELLSINFLERITDLSPLKNCAKLKYFEFRGCKSLKSISDLNMATISNQRPGDNKYRPYGANEIHLEDLKALESLAPLPPLSPLLKTVKISRLEALTSLEGLEKSQHIEKLVLTSSAIKNLSTIAKLSNLKEIVCIQCNEITDASALGNLNQLESVTFSNCTNLETMPTQWKSSVKSLNLSACFALKPLEGLPPGIDKKKIEISNRKLLPREKPVRALKSDARSIWKLLSSRDVANVRMGLSLSEALTKEIDNLTADVSVKNGELKRGKRFKGTGPAQPYLDIALFGLMAISKEGSRLAELRQEIQNLTVSLTKESADLKGFDNIENLTLLLADDTTPNLSNFGTLAALKTLKVESGGWNSVGQLLSLDGLDAPLLEKLHLKRAGLLEIKALSNSPLIKTVDLTQNGYLSSLEGLRNSAATLETLNLRECESLESISHIGDLRCLKELYLYGCLSLKSIEALGKVKTLNKITLQNCRALSSLKGIENLSLEIQNQFGQGGSINLSGCSSLSTLKYFPTNSVNVESIDVSYMKSLKSLEYLPQLSAVKSFSAYGSGLEDISALQNLPNLQSASFINCSDLKNVESLGEQSNLKNVTLSSTGVEKLPQQWQASLEELDVSQSSSLSDLGRLPASLKKMKVEGCKVLNSLKGIEACVSLNSLNAQQCDQLTSLDGLQHCKQLELLSVSVLVADHSALIHHKNTRIHVVLSDELDVFPKEWLASINQLKNSELHLERSFHLYGLSTENSKFNFTQLSLLKNVKTLSLEKCDFLINYDEMGWLLEMPNLQSLRFTPRGRMAYRLGSSVYDDLKKLRKLQETVCMEGGFTRPAFLITDS